MTTRKNPIFSASSFDNKSSCIRLIRRLGTILSVLIFLLSYPSQAQNLDVPYVPTPNDVLEELLDLADVGPGDYVIDLGSGDGRIVIAAAKRGAVGHGVDLDPQRIREARANAEEEGVSGRVVFIQGDIFETDFSNASVVTLYLLTSVNAKLRPSLIENLKPGTRVVSHSFDMGDWKPDNSVRFANRDLYYWVIPADVGENWQWETNGEQFSMAAKQEYQEVNVMINIGDRKLTTEESTLSGDRLNIIAHDEENDVRYIYSGLVSDESIDGTVQIHDGDSPRIVEWSATLND